MIVTFLAIAGGFCCGTSVFASINSHDTTNHYKMLDGNQTTIDYYVPQQNGTKQCHADTLGHIIDVTALSSAKNKLKVFMPDCIATDASVAQERLLGGSMCDALVLSFPRDDILFSVIKKE
jgi:hypothetical protein